MTHPAILKAQDVYDIEGDLNANEQAFLTAVNVIRDRKTAAYRAAQLIWGDVPKMYRSCLIIADEKERNELDRALTAYEQSLEYQDELEEVAIQMAAE